jgi:hypothetical protein
VERAVENPADPQAKDYSRDKLAAGPQAERHRGAGGARVRRGGGRRLGGARGNGPTLERNRCGSTEGNSALKGDNIMSDEIVKAKIRRALLSGPDTVTREATVGEMDAHGNTTV